MPPGCCYHLLTFSLQLFQLLACTQEVLSHKHEDDSQWCRGKVNVGPQDGHHQQATDHNQEELEGSQEHQTISGFLASSNLSIAFNGAQNVLQKLNHRANTSTGKAVQNCVVPHGTLHDLSKT